MNIANPYIAMDRRQLTRCIWDAFAEADRLTSTNPALAEETQLAAFVAEFVEEALPPRSELGGPSLEVTNDELVTVRDAMRSLNRMVEALLAGDRDKLVLMKGGKMVAVVVPLDGFQPQGTLISSEPCSRLPSS